MVQKPEYIIQLGRESGLMWYEGEIYAQSDIKKAKIFNDLEEAQRIANGRAPGAHVLQHNPDCSGDCDFCGKV